MERWVFVSPHLSLRRPKMIREERMREWIQVGAMLAGLMFAGCGPGQRDPDRGSGGPATRSVTAVDGLPEVTCGLQYVSDQSTVNGLGCNGIATYSSAGGLVPLYQGPNQMYYIGKRDGDINKAIGFVHQDQIGRTGFANPQTSDRLKVPRGTACGFRRENSIENYDFCMGFDPQVGCAPGWTRKRANDANSTVGWIWCEYDDPFGFCADGLCVNATLPDGMTCGISVNSPGDTVTGYCVNVDTRFGCPAGFVHSPSFYDDGRPAGQGLGWCARFSAPPLKCPAGQFDCCGDGAICRTTSTACSKVCCNC